MKHLTSVGRERLPAQLERQQAGVSSGALTAHLDTPEDRTSDSSQQLDEDAVLAVLAVQGPAHIGTG